MSPAPVWIKLHGLFGRTLDRQHISCRASSSEVSNILGGRAEANGRCTRGAVGIGDVGKGVVACDGQSTCTALVQGDT
jgi:hypothetical protein